MRSLLYILASSLLFITCKKENEQPGEQAGIFLLKSYDLVSLKCQVDASTAILEATPIVGNADILEYSKSNYEIRLSNMAYERIRKLADNTPFAVTVDKQVLYYGILKPGFSSSSCGHSITMDYVLTANEVALHLGYPGEWSASSIDDQRNNPLWINTLNQQRKLKP